MYPGVDQAVEALLRGQESANRLMSISSVPTDDPLFVTLLESFSTALSFFTTFTSSSQPPPYSVSSHNPETVVTRKSPKKKSYGGDGLKHYRDSPTSLRDDGFAWRKYGQKKINTFPYPRCYYRCAYAKDRNCNATKRVQQIEDSPSVYRTTYVGKHICEVNALSQSNEDITNGSKMIRFDKLDQVMPDLVPPQLKDEETIKDEGTHHTTSQEFDINELVVDDDQFLASQLPPFSPGDFSFLDDNFAFDFNLFEV